MTREEALSNVRSFIGQLTEDCQESIRELVPELAESEDERIRKWLIEMVEEVRKANPTNAEHNGNCSEAIAYLEKQKEHKPAEWSEEDENIRNDIECAIYFFLNKGSAVAPSCNTTKEEALDWLNSLRPQPHWKPSEEQMEALKLIVSNKKRYAPVLYEIALDTLYNDLKSL